MKLSKSYISHTIGKKRLKKKNYNIILNIQDFLNLWRMRNVTLDNRIVIFYTLAIMKIVCLALFTKHTCQVVKELEKIQEYYLWKNFTPDIKHETTWKD